MSAAMMRQQIRQDLASIERHRANIHARVQEFVREYLPTFPQGIYHLPERIATGKAQPSPPDLFGDQRRILQTVLAEQQSIQTQERSISKYAVEIHKKYSIPVACIVFVLVGAPLGIRARRGGMGVGFGLSIGFFLIYWAFLIGGEELADRQFLSPALAMWSPDVLIGAVGMYLTHRIIR